MNSLPDPKSIIAEHPSISARIRALAKAGYSRSQIAGLVERSYQQVRQVLVDDERRLMAGRSQIENPGMRGQRPPFAPKTAPAGSSIQRLQLDEAARITLPAEVLERLDARPGEPIMAMSDAHGVVILLSARTAMRQAQAIMRPFAKDGVLASEELIAERRAEAKRERDGD
jgi:bifunctional DNA-binding transcriptional regulator/antitoxin component of YhaV-PrlF toxin-antitoxin module